MPYRNIQSNGINSAAFRKSSVVDLLARVPVNRGSLIKSIENLLKTIETSESAVMIPTLLRDKCEFDAWELLFVAKILKASILGHSDLVEFYMNHIGQTSSQFSTSSGNMQPPEAQLHHSQSFNGFPLSPTGGAQQQQQQQQQQQNHSTISTNSTTNSWTSFNDSSSSSNYQDLSDSQHPSLDQSLAAAAGRPLQTRQAQAQPSLLQLTTNNNHLNSINSTSATNSLAPNVGFTNDNIEQLTNQLEAMQASILVSNELNHALSITTSFNGSVSPNQNSSILTPSSQAPAASQQQTAPPSTGSATRPTPPETLKTSRSAGCLFRNSSGASSPRTPNGYQSSHTPTTPAYPQAETLAGGLAANGHLQGDPSAPVKLLLQIEQLKASISHVTHLLESVVELYRKSIDNISWA